MKIEYLSGILFYVMAFIDNDEVVSGYIIIKDCIIKS